MKTFSDEALAALEAGTAIVSASLAIYGTPPVFVWGGHGPQVLTGDTGAETYLGIGDRGVASIAAGRLGGSAQGITLRLSGIDPEAIALLDSSEVTGAPAVIRRLIFDATGKTLLGAYVFTRGRVDQVIVRETIGGPAAIEVVIESAARGLGRRGGRMRSDADQRLVNPTDGFFKNVSFAAEKTLYWGGKRPATAGTAMTGGMGGGGLGGGFLQNQIRQV